MNNQSTLVNKMQNRLTLFDETSWNPGPDVVSVGRVHLSTGRLYCGDPFLTGETEPLDRTVETGSHEVRLRLLDHCEWGRRVAAACMSFRSSPTVQWKPASSRFRVDAGLCSLMDLQTARLFRQTVDAYHREHPSGNYYDDRLAAEFLTNAHPGVPGHGGDWTLHYPSPGNPPNIALFASGLGDGSYLAHWGLDASGEPSRLLVDFGLIDLF